MKINLLWIALCTCVPTFAETQNTLSITAPSVVPGSSGSFSASQTSGPSASVSGTAYDTYAGVRKFVLGTDAAGRYSTFVGAQRYGMVFDQFQIFQSFLTSNFFTVVSAGSSCPSATTYTWLLIRYRSVDTLRGAMDATNTAVRVGGVVTYDSAAGHDITGSSYFDLADVTSTSSTYTMDHLSSTCASGRLQTSSDSSKTWDTYSSIFFGTNNMVFITEGGNPVVGVAAPQVTLNASDFSALNTSVFSGMYTSYDTRTSQTQYNVFLFPDSNGTTFTVAHSTNVNDPSTYTTIGTLACTTLNSPSNGFCSGTLSLTGASGGAGNVVCQLSGTAQKTLACAAQKQGALDHFVSILATVAPQPVLALMPQGVIVSSSLSPGSPPNGLVTVSNMTGHPITTMGQPSNSGDRPQAPFSYNGGSYPGTNGNCGAVLNGYASCTIDIAYSPSSYGASIQVLRQEYDNGSGTVQATGSQVGIVGLTSIAITPTTTSYGTGDSQQLTATGSFTGGGNQDLSSVVTWSSSNSSVGSVSSSGLASFSGTGSTDVSASLASVTSNTVSITTVRGGVLVDSASGATATAQAPMRKTFFDSVNNKYWAFYYSGSIIKYAYSADGSSWTVGGSLAYNTPNFHVTYKNISGTGYVFLVAEANTYDVVLRRGTVGSSLIVFDSEITVLDGTSSSNRYALPTAAVSPNSDLWVAARKDYGADLARHYQAVAIKATNAASGSLSSWGTATVVGRKVRVLSGLTLLPRTGSNMALVVESLYPNLVAYTYNGTAWSAANTGGPSGWFDFGGGLNNIVRSLAVVGSNLYVGGDFTDAGGNDLADYLARWDGSNYYPVSSSQLNGNVVGIVSEGTNLYVAGSFTQVGGNTSCSHVAKWNGAAWTCMGTSGFSQVYSIAYDSGLLYVGGFFSNAGGNANADNVATWDGATWAALGTGVNNNVYALYVSGGTLYLGGDFTAAGGTTGADRFASYSGGTYSAYNTGLNSTVYQVGSDGTNLYAGGAFVNAGGNANADYIARWNGSAWEALSATLINSNVRAMIVSAANDIYVGGFFSLAGGNSVAHYDGATFTAVGSGVDNSVFALALSGSNLYVGGQFVTAGTFGSANRLAYWDGSSWHGTTAAALNNVVESMAVGGGNLYVGGQFQNAGGNTNADCIARWDGSDWYALGSGLGGVATPTASALAWDGSNLYVGGLFVNAGGNANADYIARWDGATWYALGTGLGNQSLALVVDGTNLYATGYFTNAGGNLNADYIARWDGSTWYSLSTGFDNIGWAMLKLGSNLYVTGNMTLAGGSGVSRVVQWDGASWSGVGAGLNSTGRAMITDGTNIYVGGDFTNVGGNANADYVAKWDGANWTALGTGQVGNVYSLAWDGANLYVGGSFINFGGNGSADKVAKWDGANWTAVATGLNGTPSKMLFDSRILYAGGSIGATGGNETGASFFTYYAPTVSYEPPATVKHSAIADSTGDLHVEYLNSSGYAEYRKYTSGSWTSATTLGSAIASAACLMGSSDAATLFAGWIESGTIKYKEYHSAAWDGAATTIPGLGSNQALSCTEALNSGNGLFLWTRGSSTYDVHAYTVP